MAKVTIAQQESTTFKKVEIGQIYKDVTSGFVYLKIQERCAYNLQAKSVVSASRDTPVLVCKYSEIIVA